MAEMSWEAAVAELLSRPDQLELVRACFYDDPLLAAAQRYYESTEWQACRKLIPAKPGKALDVGAGRGISSYALARDGWAVTALEPDPSLLVGGGAIRALAQDAGLHIHVEQNWGERLPFSDSAFDLVHARQVLHHARDLKQLCSEASRVLKPGGTFVATREHVISTDDDLDIFLRSHPLHQLYGGENAFCLPVYLKAIRQSGLSLTHVLNPMASDINLYPETVDGLRMLVAKRVGIPVSLIRPWLLALRGKFLSQPGRLYTFVAIKG